MNRRYFLQVLGCGCLSIGLTSCSTVAITDRKQLKLIPESTLNAKAAKIYEEVKGVILRLSHSESSDELLSNISFLKGRKPKTKNDGPDTRIIGVGAQILKDLGVTKIRLLGASLKYPLAGFDLEITEFIN